MWNVTRDAGSSVRRSAVAVAVLAVLAVGACSSSESDSSPQSGDGGQAKAATSVPAASAVRHLDVKAFADAMSQPGTVLLDVRTPAEFADGHIAKAVNMDMQASDFTKKLATLDKSASYAIYCRTGHRSGVAAEQMAAAGFTKVADLAGGVVAWTGAGRQLTTG